MESENFRNEKGTGSFSIVISLLLIALLSLLSYICYDKLVFDKNNNNLLNETRQKYDDGKKKIKEIESMPDYISVSSNTEANKEYKVYGSDGSLYMYAKDGDMYIATFDNNNSVVKDFKTSIKEKDVSKVYVSWEENYDSFDVVYKDGRVHVATLQRNFDRLTGETNFKLVEEFMFSKYKVKDLSLTCSQYPVNAGYCIKWVYNLTLIDGTKKTFKWSDDFSEMK